MTVKFGWNPQNKINKQKCTAVWSNSSNYWTYIIDFLQRLILSSENMNRHIKTNLWEIHLKCFNLDWSAFFWQEENIYFLKPELKL